MGSSDTFPLLLVPLNYLQLSNSTYFQEAKTFSSRLTLKNELLK